MVGNIKAPLEETEQRALVQWLRLKKISHFSVGNENVHSFLNRDLAVKMQGKAKAMGAVKGVSDMVILLDRCVLFIELKRADRSLSKVSKEQTKFIDMVNGLEYAHGAVCYGYLNAIEFIEGYL